MLNLLRSRGPAAVTPVVDAGPAATSPSDVVQRLSRQVSHIGRDAAETRGVIEDTQKIVTAQLEAMTHLNVDLARVQQTQQAIGEATQESRDAVVRARQQVEQVARVGALAEPHAVVARQVRRSLARSLRSVRNSSKSCKSSPKRRSS